MQILARFALRLQLSLLDEARKGGGERRRAVQPVLNVAVAEKLSALRTESCFQERAACSPKALEHPGGTVSLVQEPCLCPKHPPGRKLPVKAARYAPPRSGSGLDGLVRSGFLSTSRQFPRQT
ncbi:hypothetical protein MES5069_130069 [Mesorhizobium escarrei]|uniref:Uncharacterized protein n=1 Tax=Mesorhizobium escarrei TaxID=666018 RepID=A0ABM9DHR8_9HYPH|nr:hypothetical protein MES5069_130069 [Mesorhizobium escarrei]